MDKSSIDCADDSFSFYEVENSIRYDFLRKKDYFALRKRFGNLLKYYFIFSNNVDIYIEDLTFGSFNDLNPSLETKELFLNNFLQQIRTNFHNLKH